MVHPVGVIKRTQDQIVILGALETLAQKAALVQQTFAINTQVADVIGGQNEIWRIVGLEMRFQVITFQG